MSLTRAPGETIVIKIGGAALDDAAALATLARHVAGLAATHPVVVVHGGGAAVDRQLERLGLTTPRREGLRITPADIIDDVVGVLAGATSVRLTGALSEAGAAPVGLTLGAGRLTRAALLGGLDFDPGRVGAIVGGDASLLDVLLANDFLPVISSIAHDDDGAPLNVNADSAAAAIAGLLGARDLILLTDVPGVLDANGTLLESLDAPTVTALTDDGTITGGMLPKVRAALDAAETSGVPVTIATWRTAPSAFAWPGTRVTAAPQPPLPLGATA